MTTTSVGSDQLPKSIFSRPQKPLILPFVNTTFATELKLYFTLWPLWWFMGIEQLLPPFFLGWATLRMALRKNGRVRVDATTVFAILLALWWIVPTPWVRSEMFDVFVRTFLTVLSQAMMLFLFVNCIRTRQDWEKVVVGLDRLTFYIVVGALLFVVAGVRGKITSLLGYLLPASIIQTSEFFSSIVARDFGLINPGAHGALPYRLSSFTLEPADLGTLSLVLIPFMVWRISEARGLMRGVRMVYLAVLLYCFVYAEVRIAYIAFMVGVAFFAAWMVGLLQTRNRAVLHSLVALALAALFGSGYFLYQEVASAVADAFSTVRPGSIFVRVAIYEETFKLLPEHLIAGWGTSIRIEGFPNVYAAGTHSNYLEMLFQHGIVGLLLYLGLWATIWQRALYWFRHRSPIVSRTFWCIVVITLLMFNIRESTASWMWDQTVTMTVWSIWGLILSASHVNGVRSRPAEDPREQFLNR